MDLTDFKKYDFKQQPVVGKALSLKVWSLSLLHENHLKCLIEMQFSRPQTIQNRIYGHQARHAQHQ